MRGVARALWEGVTILASEGMAKMQGSLFHFLTNQNTERAKKRGEMKNRRKNLEAPNHCLHSGTSRLGDLLCLGKPVWRSALYRVISVSRP